MHRKRQLFVISGPSGAGKGSVIQQLLKEDPELFFSVSATTRSPRPGEVDGRDYFFINGDTFRQMIDRNEFLEHAFVHGNYYGTPAKAVEEKIAGGLDVVLDIDVQGALLVMESRPHSKFIFIAPPGMDPEILRKRLHGRGTESEEKIEKRIKTALWELTQAHRYQYLVYNDDLSRAVSDVRAIIRAARLEIEREK